jgi:hypothetical protein
MLEAVIVIGFTMTIVEIIKVFEIFKTKVGKLTLPLISCLLCGGLNVINAMLFSNVELILALKEGIILGALASGLYATGKKYLNKTEIVP